MKRLFKQRGSTMIDICASCLVGSVSMALALPSYQTILERTQRADALAALERVQLAQTRHLADHGRYAPSLADLGAAGASDSERGLYRITLSSAHPHSFEVRAIARPDRNQARAPDCAEIALRVTRGAVSYEPSARCWNS